MDGNESFCVNSKKTIFFLGGGGSGLWGQGGFDRRIEVFWSIGRGFVGSNIGGRGWYGGCEPRIEGIVQCTKRYCTILRKLKKMCGGGRGRGNI